VRQTKLLRGAILASVLATALCGSGPRAHAATAGPAITWTIYPTYNVLSSDALDYGAQQVGTISAYIIRVNNADNYVIRLTTAFAGDAMQDYAAVNNCSGYVYPGNYCDITVGFRPSAAGSRSAVLGLQAYDANTGSTPTRAIGLHGIGVSPQPPTDTPPPPTATSTPVPPANTPVPPTATNTPVPPTSTPVPTSAAAPPTNAPSQIQPPAATTSVPDEGVVATTAPAQPQPPVGGPSQSVASTSTPVRYQPPAYTSPPAPTRRTPLRYAARENFVLLLRYIAPVVKTCLDAQTLFINGVQTAARTQANVDMARVRSAASNVGSICASATRSLYYLRVPASALSTYGARRIAVDMLLYTFAWSQFGVIAQAYLAGDTSPRRVAGLRVAAGLIAATGQDVVTQYRVIMGAPATTTTQQAGSGTATAQSVVTRGLPSTATTNSSSGASNNGRADDVLTQACQSQVRQGYISADVCDTANRWNKTLDTHSSVSTPSGHGVSMAHRLSMLQQAGDAYHKSAQHFGCIESSVNHLAATC